MIEKRFRAMSNEVKQWYCIESVEGEMFSIQEVVDLLNEQQATITHLEKVNGKNFAKRRLLEQDNLVLRNENEQLRKELKEIKENPINYF